MEHLHNKTGLLRFFVNNTVFFIRYMGKMLIGQDNVLKYPRGAGGARAALPGQPLPAAAAGHQDPRSAQPSPASCLAGF